MGIAAAGVPVRGPSGDVRAAAEVEAGSTIALSTSVEGVNGLRIAEMGNMTAIAVCE
jgi:hypothetical protein